MGRKQIWLATAVAIPVLAAAAGLTLGRHHSDAQAATTAPPPEAATPPGKAYASAIPAADRKAYFGELHLHTTNSFDAWSFGTKTTPDEAYKFARGQTVMIPASQFQREQTQTDATGMIPVKRKWPLDFMAVTDHSEYMGVANQFDDPNNPISKGPVAAEVAKDPHQMFVIVAKSLEGAAGGDKVDLNADKAMADTWERVVRTANNNYVPGKFTTFIGYEWTSAPDGQNLHRNVIFNADHAPQPFTSNQSKRPEDLWSFLEKVRAGGIDVIAIPHNADASNGLMYDWNDSDKRPISEAYAQRRLLNEPLTEIAQNKGVSDTVPEISPNDEFANFERYDHLISRPNVKSKVDGSYIRQALGRGLVLLGRVGANPYKYGLVGGTDIHNGLSYTDEDGIGGSFASPAGLLPTGDAAKRMLQIIRMPARLDSDADAKGEAHSPQKTLEVGTGGVTGVWAEENTRNSIYAALKRKETFATTGTRVKVRMFGSWAYPANLPAKGDWVKTAYAKGVPMGSDLPARGAGKAPTLVLQATKDPDGANLDRIQVIKMWQDADGYKEKIFDVALSGGRKADPKTGKAPAVGNTVDLKTGKYTNTIGAPVLTAEWTDPTFDPKKAAVYYARVLEIPTPRWSTHLAIVNHLPIPTAVPATIQERAWTSPIWFTPPKS
ncbi:MAG: DUF3604 domain-containing protein [Proteobacteria bacterium]|nr:DUF3604 domain-containing protein [Pseudomonadota bacterium]